jgi:GntR family transcriptional regulator/MocR family aminotransferase
MQLAIPLSESGVPLFRQLYTGLRAAILRGAFRAGEKLPSSRELAEQLGISRTVVLLAYDQLLAEGYLVGRKGSGTYVSSAVSAGRSAGLKQSASLRLSHFGSAAAEAWSRVNYPRRPVQKLPFDFASGISDIEIFPFEMWRRILLRCARRAPVSDLDYGPAGGNTKLREAICAHLRRSRAVACDPAEVIIVNGSQQALDLIARVLIEPGDRVALEDPSYQGTTEALRAAGARLIPVPVDHHGVNPSRLPANARLAFVTPSHQFPTGAILPLARRVALLDWAKRQNSIVIEDDYDGEFRYDGQPLESLQGLDREGRVIYIGTFSRTVFSTLRIGYLIAPKRLVRAFLAAKWLSDRQTATLEQEALAEFISGGMYERYLRRLRRRNAARRDALLSAIGTYLEGVKVTGYEAGGHVVLWPGPGVSEKAVIERAAAQGVRVYGLSGYRQRTSARSGIILRYSRMNETQIREGIRRLRAALSPSAVSPKSG